MGAVRRALRRLQRLAHRFELGRLAAIALLLAAAGCGAKDVIPPDEDARSRAAEADITLSADREVRLCAYRDRGASQPS